MNAERELILRNRGFFTDKVIVEVAAGDTSWCIVAVGFENYPEPQYYQIMWKTEADDELQAFDTEHPLSMNYDEYALVREFIRVKAAGDATNAVSMLLTNALDSDERIEW
jgi:hypothetical protein